MPNKTGIVNQALVRLGQSPVLSLEDGRARDAKQRYDDVVSGLLEMQPPWNFATRRATLTATTATAPVWGYSAAYPLPEDFKLLIRLEGNTDPFRIEHDTASGSVLLTDGGSVNILYVANITDAALWPQLFADVVAARLAWQIGLKITNDARQVEQLKSEYQEALDDARYSDATQAPIEQVNAVGWLGAREGGVEPYRRIEPVS